MSDSTFIGAQTREYRVYIDGYDLLGVAEVKLPEFKFKSITLEGTGVLGEIEIPSTGSVEKLELEVKFNTVSQPAFRLLDLNNKLLEFKAVINGVDSADHTINGQGLYISVRGSCKGFNLGTLKMNDMLNVPFTLEATALEVKLNGEQLYKIDKLNGIFEAAGRALVKKLGDYF
jgi:P2 family phage contractile tail tube protein